MHGSLVIHNTNVYSCVCVCGLSCWWHILPLLYAVVVGQSKRRATAGKRHRGNITRCNINCGRWVWYTLRCSDRSYKLTVHWMCHRRPMIRLVLSRARHWQNRMRSKGYCRRYYTLNNLCWASIASDSHIRAMTDFVCTVIIDWLTERRTDSVDESCFLHLCRGPDVHDIIDFRSRPIRSRASHWIYGILYTFSTGTQQMSNGNFC